MGLPKLSLVDLARSGHVTRWHSVRTLRDQTLAEHHYMVARISNKLAKDIFGKQIGAEGLLQIMDYALLHDTPELLTGDLPSPMKWHIAQISGDDNPVEAIEKEIAPWLWEKKQEMEKGHPEYLLVIKLADVIDALVFISSEGLGEHARSVIQILEDLFAKKLKQASDKFPQYQWNMAQEICQELLNKREVNKMAFEIQAAKKEACI